MPAQPAVIIGAISILLTVITLYFRRESIDDREKELNRVLNDRAVNMGRMAITIDRIRLEPEQSWGYRLARLWWWKDIEGKADVAVYTKFEVEEELWEHVGKKLDLIREESDAHDLPEYKHQITEQVGANNYQHVFEVESVEGDGILTVVYSLLFAIRTFHEEGNANVVRKMGDMDVPVEDNPFEF